MSEAWDILSSASVAIEDCRREREVDLVKEERRKNQALLMQCVEDKWHKGQKNRKTRL